MDIIKTETDMINWGEKLGKTLPVPVTIELIGDVGTGKTTLVKGIARALGITTPITSPSFTLSKTYPLPPAPGTFPAPARPRSGRSVQGVSRLSHYDFYRLADPGILAEELAESIHDPNTITIVEWAETVKNVLPEKRTTITLKYLDDGSRSVEIAQ